MILRSEFWFWSGYNLLKKKRKEKKEKKERKKKRKKKANAFNIDMYLDLETWCQQSVGIILIIDLPNVGGVWNRNYKIDTTLLILAVFWSDVENVCFNPVKSVNGTESEMLISFR